MNRRPSFSVHPEMSVDVPLGDRRYTCSEAPGQVSRFEDMLAANAGDEDVMRVIAGLRAGEHRVLNLGAGGLTEIARVC